MFPLMSMILVGVNAMNPGSRLTAANGGDDKRENLLNLYSSLYFGDGPGMRLLNGLENTPCRVKTRHGESLPNRVWLYLEKLIRDNSSQFLTGLLSSQTSPNY